QITHFADQHHIGVFAQRRAQGSAEGLRVGVYFALVYQTALVLVDKLDGIFNGYDVVVPLDVDFVQHGGKRGGFAGTCRSRHQNQSTWLFAQPGNHLRQIELLESLDLERNHAVNGPDSAAMVKAVAAEAVQAFQSEGKVQLQILFKTMLLRVGEDAVGELFGFRRSQRRHIERLQVPVHAHLWRRVGGDVEIAA